MIDEKPKLCYAIAVESMDFVTYFEVKAWLEDSVGPQGRHWDIDHDYNLTNLLMSEQAYACYLLRYSR